MGKMVEMDESAVQQYQSLANFLDAGLKNPETRRSILEIQKKLNPKAYIPELDSQAPVMQAVDEIKKELAAERAERAKEKAEAEVTTARNALASKWEKGQAFARESGYSDEGIQKLEAFMQEEGIASHTHAMAAFERINPRSEPIASNANPFTNMFSTETRKSDEMKGLFENPNSDGWLAQQVNATLGRRVM